MGEAPLKKRIVVGDETDILEITPLGAGSEVGRSCHLLTFKGKTVMLDCGVHPAYQGIASLPFFDSIDDVSNIDLLLCTHFHLDHSAAIPYLLNKTAFNGRVFMTHPTKAVFKMILDDFIRVSNVGVDDRLFSESDLARSMEKIELINFHQECEHNGIKFKCYNAGHVLGACMFMIEIAGVNILYTGDYSREEDRHLMAAEVPEVKPDVLIVESTYGIQRHEPREEREQRFCGYIRDCVAKGGRCLIPVFALGRAQELLLILDEYWEAHPDIQRFNIYFASSLAKKGLTVYQTYINAMNKNIKKLFETGNPFLFKHITSLKNIDHFDDREPCVVMASPGMLQSSPSRDLFERWCDNKRNTLVIPGYVVEGTLGKEVLSEPESIVTANGISKPLRMSVHYVSFSAHCDFAQTSEFISLLRPPHIVLVHGEEKLMRSMKNELDRQFKTENMQIYTPRNEEPVRLEFRSEKTARVVGRLAKSKPEEGKMLDGLLIRKNFTYQIVDPLDLAEYSPLSAMKIKQRLVIPFEQKFDFLVEMLAKCFHPVRVISNRGEGEQANKLRVLGEIEIGEAEFGPNQYVMEWESGIENDMLADSIIAIMLSAERNPVSAKAMTASGAAPKCSSCSQKRKADAVKMEVEKEEDEGEVAVSEPTVPLADGVSSLLSRYYTSAEAVAESLCLVRDKGEQGDDVIGVVRSTPSKLELLSEEEVEGSDAVRKCGLNLIKTREEADKASIGGDNYCLHMSADVRKRLQRRVDIINMALAPISRSDV